MAVGKGEGDADGIIFVAFPPKVIVVGGATAASLLVRWDSSSQAVWSLVGSLDGSDNGVGVGMLVASMPARITLIDAISMFQRNS